jgi:ribosomal protein L3 glutamine methyltransferase
VPAPLTVGDFVRAATRRMQRARLHFGHGTHDARGEAMFLALHVLKLSYESLQPSLGRRLSAIERARLESLLARRIATRLPAPYLTHEAWLGEYRFYVDRRVIVPRSFIAELLRAGLEPWLPQRVRNALDLCTGSGCLAVLLAKRFPEARVDASDLSTDALAVARRNVARYRLGRRIRLVRSDLFLALRGRRYDLIVSNPPYVKAATMRRLPPEYRHEPRAALAGGPDGLDIVRRILAESRARLAPGGLLVCEIGHNRRALEKAFPSLPFLWLETSAGPEHVFLLEREQLPLTTATSTSSTRARRAPGARQGAARAPRSAAGRARARRARA